MTIFEHLLGMMALGMFDEDEMNELDDLILNDDDYMDIEDQEVK